MANRAVRFISNETSSNVIANSELTVNESLYWSFSFNFYYFIFELTDKIYFMHVLLS